MVYRSTSRCLGKSVNKRGVKARHTYQIRIATHGLRNTQTNLVATNEPMAPVEMVRGRFTISYLTDVFGDATDFRTDSMSDDGLD